MHPTVAAIHRGNLRSDLPEFRAGDTVSVDFKVIEGAKERLQTFTGVVIQRRGDGARVAAGAAEIAYAPG